MYHILEKKINLEQLKNIAEKLANISKPSDIYLLKGDLGSGKTTFTRFFINYLYDLKKISKPSNINSPSFPILINYTLNDFEILHYDLFRLNNKKELQELNIFENFSANISIIEWPELILNNLQSTNHYLINFDIVNLSERVLSIQHSTKKLIEL